jgi:hypothetical protein
MSAELLSAATVPVETDYVARARALEPLLFGAADAS